MCRFKISEEKMSINTTESVKCPECGRLHELCVWNSITVSDSPDLKKDLLSGKVNILRCETCGRVALLPYPLLYHDEEQKLLISFVPCVDDETKRRLFSNLKNNFKKNDEIKKYEDYNLRFVSDFNEFLEKILVFDSGLHDKVTELIKLLILSQEPEKEENRTAVFGKKENGELEFLVRDVSEGMCYTSRVPVSTYDTLCSEIKKSGIKYKSFNFEEVNAEYASKIITGMNN